MVFENGVKNIQAAAYNGARTVFHTSMNFSESQSFTHLCIGVTIKLKCYFVEVSPLV